MLENKEGLKKTSKKPSIFVLKLNLKKNIYYFLFFIFAIFLFFIFFIPFDRGYCGDGTPSGKCSKIVPYFCSKGVLTENGYSCGCPLDSTQKGYSCEHRYQTVPKIVSFEYLFKGDPNKIYLEVYKGMVDYLKRKPQTKFYSAEENYSLQDFKLRIIGEEEQRNLLLPLVVEIQNMAKSKEDQARIAISLVQNIPYDYYISFDKDNPLSWELKYPYDVLYEKKGLCGSKSDLLAFLLKEIGYGVVIFHYYPENHEAVGIKCPLKHSLNNTGYCFVETTQPAIISFSKGDYSEKGKLFSNPEIIYISDGISLGNNLQEYKDARDLEIISRASEKSSGKINLLEYLRYNQLADRYGLYKRF